MHRSAVALAVALAALGGARALSAQSPEDREGLVRFRDSIGSVTDTFLLQGLEVRLIEAAKQSRNDPMMHLRLGFVAIRIADQGSQTRYDDAAGEFQWATELAPTWPWGWYGLGMAEDGIGDSQVSIVAGLQSMFGKDHLSRAANAYAHSVEVDPAFVLGLIQLANTALRQRVNIKIELAREALRQAAATTAGANPEVLLYRGRVEREVGNPDSAVAAFQGYLARGGARGPGLLELARSFFVQGSREGQSPYYEGAGLDDPNSVAMYREDLALIANDSALAEFDGTIGPARTEFLRRFWGQRDRLELLHDGERLREHYRRLYYARRHFMLVSTNRHYDIVERYRSGSRDYDDRGIIYIRHGEPTERASCNPPGMEPNESWHYVRSTGDLVFHFVAREDVQDYKLIESVFDVMGFEAAMAMRRTDVTGYANDLVVSREHFSPIYTKLLGTGAAGSQKYLSEERQLGSQSIRRGTSSDSYELSFPQPLRAWTRAIVVGQDSGRALLHLTYAIPGSSLMEVPSNRGHVYPVRLRLSVFDSVGHPVAFTDTTRLFVARDPVARGEFLLGRVAIRVPPGRFRYRLALDQAGDRGLVLPPDSVTVDDFSGIYFAISGIVLGSDKANLAWHPTAQDTVLFYPVGQFDRKATMDLYYEVYGLAAGTGFKTEVVVSKQGGGGLLGLFGGKKAAIRLSFDDQAQGTATRIHRNIGLEKLSGGKYWIEIVATTPDGQSQRSRAPFEVRD
jgi:GWxTD domain-containing protein